VERSHPASGDVHGGLDAARRAVVSLAGGLLVTAPVALVAPVEYWPLVGWDVTAAAYVAWVWVAYWGLDGGQTARAAEREDPTRRTVDLVLLSAAVVSLAAVAFALVQASSPNSAATALICVLTVAVSWALVNTVFALRYARHYYEGENGGIEFHQDGEPAYSDFAYVAFTVGMTFNVSDTDVCDASIRRAVMAHALLSYVFGTGILAVAINIVANMGQGGGGG
jgi:uncharacterized membrane protein